MKHNRPVLGAGGRGQGGSAAGGGEWSWVKRSERRSRQAEGGAAWQGVRMGFPKHQYLVQGMFQL